jgi:tellurite resistance protein
MWPCIAGSPRAANGDEAGVQRQREGLRTCAERRGTRSRAGSCEPARLPDKVALTLSWQQARSPNTLLCVAPHIVIGAAYLAKWVRYPAAARAEVRHPIRMAFAPTMTIAILIPATALTRIAAGVAGVLWWVGAVGHLIATILVLSAWFTRGDILVGHVTPAWFIPIVGNVITPLPAREVGSVELAWLSFGIAVIFWLALLPLLLQRVIVHDQPLPEKLLPTLAIFIAPPAVILLSWQALTGARLDPVVRILYAAVIAFVLLVLAQAARLRRVPLRAALLGLHLPVRGLSGGCPLLG